MNANAFHVVADIGGTNARFALIAAQGDGQLHHQRTYFCADFARMEDALGAYIHDSGCAINSAAIAIATPIAGDSVQMTNHHWQFSIQRAQRELQLQRLLVLNDFTALAMSLPHLPAQQLVQLGGRQAVTDAAIGVIGPGTGLGVSGLLRCDDKWQPLASEGGHVTFAPRSRREWQVCEILTQRYQSFPSYERIVSGPGLCAIYESLCELDGADPLVHSPAEVAQHAVQRTDARFAEVFDFFCGALGSAAGNLALTLGARGGIYIGGGIVPRWGDAFLQSRFREAFEAKGRLRSYLADIPVFVVHAAMPALIGAASALVPTMEANHEN